MYPATRLPDTILLDGLPASIKTKAQLLGQLEPLLGPALSPSILDIELVQRGSDCFASVRFSTGTQCYRAVSTKEGLIKAHGWSVVLDGEQKAFRRKIALLEQLALRQEVVKHRDRQRDRKDDHRDPRERRDDHRERRDDPHRESRRDDHRREDPRYTCDTRIPCLIIDYERFSSRHSSRDLVALFHAYPSASTERHSSSWHLHIRSTDEVRRAWSERDAFVAGDGRRLRPYLSHALPSEAPSPRPPPREDPLDAIRNLFIAKTEPSAPVRIFEPIKAQAVDATLLNLPTFNRKYLEQLQALAAEDEDDAESTQADVLDKEEVQVQENELPNEIAVEDLVEPVSAVVVVAEKPKRRSRKSVGLAEPEPVPEAVISTPLLEAGCARLAGYYKQLYKTVWFEPIVPPVSEDQPAIAPKRSTRATGRRQDLFASTPASALLLRQKHVILGRSSIHSYGLFSGEDIPAGELVIEYVGEVIRHSLANVRERRLEEQLKAAGSTEMASSYFFRLDLTYVVDATHTGNLARFVNHCCDPNCIAKVVQLEGRQHIVFYARRHIGRGDEITYDYKFAIEEDPEKKIRCLCGAAACRKYLN